VAQGDLHHINATSQKGVCHGDGLRDIGDNDDWNGLAFEGWESRHGWIQLVWGWDGRRHVIRHQSGLKERTSAAFGIACEAAEVGKQLAATAVRICC
jgi:hypothetical protein